MLTCPQIFALILQHFSSSVPTRVSLIPKTMRLFFGLALYSLEALKAAGEIKVRIKASGETEVGLSAKFRILKGHERVPIKGTRRCNSEIAFIMSIYKVSRLMILLIKGSNLMQAWISQMVSWACMILTSGRQRTDSWFLDLLWIKKACGVIWRQYQRSSDCRQGPCSSLRPT